MLQAEAKVEVHGKEPDVKMVLRPRVKVNLQWEESNMEAVLPELELHLRVGRQILIEAEVPWVRANVKVTYRELKHRLKVYLGGHIREEEFQKRASE